MTVRPKVGLFITCLADMFRPQIGFAAVKLFEQAGCDVDVPRQTCCGQPAFNAGDPADAKALARNIIRNFASHDYVVVPSGSCAGMIRLHYPELLKDDTAWGSGAAALARKTHELFSFLVNVRGLTLDAVSCSGTAAYHDSCSSLREMQTRDEPRALLAGVTGLTVKDIPDAEVCCGFGGFFSVKFPEISARMADDKLAAAAKTGADQVIAGDLGCLLHLAGRAARCGSKLKFRHAAEIAAGQDGPAIGEAP